MKFLKPKYIDWFLEKTDEDVKLESGEIVCVYKIVHEHNDEILNEWARHILRHYRDDAQIQKGADIYCGGDKSKYIRDYIIHPTKNKDISGDFGEFVFSDFLEYILEYEVPRYKKHNTYPSNPTQGIDLFGFKLMDAGKNEVCFMEVKSRLSLKNFKALEYGIEESINRDDTQRALILENARLFFASNDKIMESKIVSLQSSDNPPIRKSMAGIISKADNCCTNDFIGVKIKAGEKCIVFALYGEELWDLAQNLYKRACL